MGDAESTLENLIPCDITGLDDCKDCMYYSANRCIYEPIPRRPLDDNDDTCIARRRLS